MASEVDSEVSSINKIAFEVTPEALETFSEALLTFAELSNNQLTFEATFEAL